MDLADLESTESGGFDLSLFRVDERAGGDPAIPEGIDRTADGLEVPGDIKPSLGGDLLTSFGDEHGDMGAGGYGDGDHFRCRRHLEIEVHLHRLGQLLEVPVLDVAAIFTKVHGDALGSAELSLDGRLDRVGLPGPACLTHGRDMINVDAEVGHGFAP